MGCNDRKTNKNISRVLFIILISETTTNFIFDNLLIDLFNKAFKPDTDRSTVKRGFCFVRQKSHDIWLIYVN